MQLIITWAQAHPEAMALLVWPIVTAIVTALLKPRTPAEYLRIAVRNPMWFWARWAAFLQLIGGLGFDTPKVVEALKKFVTGRFRLPPTLGPMLVLFVALLGQTACTPDARQALLETALDAAKCAVLNQNLPDKDILKVCAVEAIDAERILRIAGESRKASADAALRAEARAAACGKK